MGSQNITLRFLQDNQANTCNYDNSSKVLTFTTSSVPVISHCFDFSNLFGGNAAQGFVNQTENLGWAGGGQEAGIRWQLLNLDTFDPQANYSNILYRQHVLSPSSDDDKPGHYANRRVTIYGAPGCSEADPSDNHTLLPWYGFSCWSEEAGSCGKLPYGIASFSVQPGPDDDERDGTCWDFAERGGAAGMSGLSRQAMMSSLFGTAVAVWLAL